MTSSPPRSPERPPARGETWWSPPTSTPTVELVRLDPALLHALAAGNLAAAQAGTALALSPYLVESGSRRTWEYRQAQLADTPADADWVTRLVVEGGTGTVVGAAGFHGAQDARGMVEVGYRIDPGHRRRGFARAALHALLARAALEPEVAVVRASVSPGNDASLALIRGEGFVEVGEQWDDEDGLELLFERAARG